MRELAKKHIDRLKDIKKKVEESRQYFQDNVDRYHEFKQFVFKTSLTEEEMGVLESNGKPTVEFNILEAYVSRLRGEFAKQQPSLTVRAADGVPLFQLTKNFIDTLKVIEAHLRAIFFDGDDDMLEYQIYSDLLAGGFSTMRVYTEYVNELSFEQNIKVERVFDPTLCGFDPLARDSHKGDGRYAYEIYPMTRGEFEDEYGKEATQDMKFTRNLEGYDWSFKNEQEEVVLVCDFYEKIAKKAKIVKLSNGHTITEKEYKRFLELWEEANYLEQPPLVVDERYTMIETTGRYRFCETKVLDFVETNYKYLPLVFVDGNSVTLQDGGANYQMTRPYVYHAKGIQRLKNYAGQSLGNELENTIQHKFVVAVESIPEDYLHAYENVQKADTLVYNHFLDRNSPDITLPPPREIVRTPIPPQITETFTLSDQMTQAILGSYDNQNMNRAELSGIAIARGAMQSNNASVPYIVGFIRGLNRVAQIIIDLIPKYYRTPRSLPVIEPSGKRSHVLVNQTGNLYMNYDPNSIQVKVEAGVNFAMQKEIAMQTITQLMGTSPLFADFMNRHGLQILLDNIDIRGVDELKSKAETFEQDLQKQAKQQEQFQMQEQQAKQMEQGMAMEEMKKRMDSPTLEQVEAAKVQEKAKYDAAKVSVDEQEAQTKFLQTLADIRAKQTETEIRRAEISAENLRSNVDMMTDLAHTMDKLAENTE